MPGSPKWSPSLRFPHQNPLSSSTALHASPIYFSILSPAQYWMRSTDHETYYDVFSTPLLPRPSKAQLPSSTLYSQTRSAYVTPSMSATKFHTHAKNRQNCIYIQYIHSAWSLMTGFYC
jgi:hypothetical protein